MSSLNFCDPRMFLKSNKPCCCDCVCISTPSSTARQLLLPLFSAYASQAPRHMLGQLFQGLLESDKQAQKATIAVKWWNFMSPYLCPVNKSHQIVVWIRGPWAAGLCSHLLGSGTSGTSRNKGLFLPRAVGHYSLVRFTNVLLAWRLFLWQSCQCILGGCTIQGGEWLKRDRSFEW